VAFDRFTAVIDYKAEAEEIDVELVSERDTSKSCLAAATRTTTSVPNMGCTCVKSERR